MTVEPHRIPAVSAAWAGIAAGAVALGAAEVVASALPGSLSPFATVAEAVIDAAPGPLVELAVQYFGAANRLVLVLGIGGVCLAGAVTAGQLSRTRTAAGAAVLASFGVLGAVALATRATTPTSTAVLAPLAGVLAGVATLLLLVRAARHAAEVSAHTIVSPTEDTDPDRRRFVVTIAGLVTLAAILATSGRLLRSGFTRGTTGVGAVTLPPPPDPLPPPAPATGVDVDGISPVITPIEDFFRIDTAFTIPRIDAAEHRVRFTGMVDRPFTLTYADLVELADTEVDVTLACVSNEVGGGLVSTGRWFGAPLAPLLERAGVHAAADQVVGRAVDGWTAGFPVSAVTDGRPALLAIGMNGDTLPRRHGFPVRLVIAGLYGYVSDTKWLSEIELTTFDAFEAYWVPRGWAQHAPIKLQSRIDVPRDRDELPAGATPVAGVAWTDEQGVTGVEISVDDGPWEQATLAQELARTTWRQWKWVWQAAPGRHRLRVRARDARGEVQTAERRPPAPDGATGHHTIEVQVR